MKAQISEQLARIGDSSTFGKTAALAQRIGFSFAI
jgi:hypothetical protein